MLAAFRRSLRLSESVIGNSVIGNHLTAASVQLRGKKKKSNGAKTVQVSKESAGLVDLKKFEGSMSNTLEALKNSYANFRSGLPNPALLDDVAVEAYGSRTSLKTVAQVSVRDGRTLFVTTFDEGLASHVEKAVRGAGMNLNPISEGKGRFRIPIAKPSNESRRAMRDLVQQEGEAAKIATRLVRRKAMDQVKNVKDDMPKDDFKRFEQSIQVMTDRWIDRITHTQQLKVQSIMDPSLSIRK